MCTELIICDFDGTLVDTFEANFRAYQHAFSEVGMELSREKYMECFGLRFDNFMKAVGVNDPDTAISIREIKAQCYPNYFKYLKANRPLLDFVRAFHQQGGKTAIASTARRENLLNALTFIGALNNFDLVLAGENVQHGKPSPEIYEMVLRKMKISPVNALVFEDSEVGCQAAENAGIQYIKINNEFYGD